MCLCVCQPVILLITLCVYVQQGYAFGCDSLYIIIMSTKNRLYNTLVNVSALLFENLQLSVYSTTFSLSLNASSVVCYIQ